MAEVMVHYEQGELGEQTLVRNGRIEVRWEEDAQLVLSDPYDVTTRIACGPLFELAPSRAQGRPSTLGLGLDHASGQPPSPIRINDAHGPGIELRRNFPIAVQPLSAEWSLRVYEQHALVLVTLSVHNVGAEPVTIRRIFPFVTGSWWGNGALRLHNQQKGFVVYKNGWQSWSYAGGMPPGLSDFRPEPSDVTWHAPGGGSPRQPISGKVDVVSEGGALLGIPNERNALFAGFLSNDEWIGQIYAQRDEGAFAACALCDDYELTPGEAIRTPPLALALGPQDALLLHYAEAVAREQLARRARRTYTGWCSWYYYYTDITEAAVQENIRALQSLRPLLPLHLVQIDDGYQEAVGDWLSVNNKFPHGMAPLAEEIRGAGFEPGIWLAPFTVAANSHLAREHPRWLVHNASGAPAYGGTNWGSDLYALDTTHPEARDWLRTLFETVVREWGYRYLKLDFLASGALLGQRYDPTMTRAHALRDGLALIREVVGDEVYILGCGCPLLSAVGLVDAMRIGPDSAPYWRPGNRSKPDPAPSTEGAARNTLARSWMQPALWSNDPDCLLVRSQQSSLTLDEVIAFASAVGLTGGMVLLSDRIAQLTFERLEIVAKLLPPMAERALPMNYLGVGLPEQVIVRIVRPWGSWLLVGLFNNEPRRREMGVQWHELGLESGTYHTVEFWAWGYLGRSESGAAVSVGAHGAAVLAIHAQSEEPLLLSTSLHISQGAVEITHWAYDRESKTITWVAHPGRHAVGAFMLWLPDTLWPARLSSDASGARWQRKPRSEIIVTAEIHDEARFTFELESES